MTASKGRRTSIIQMPGTEFCQQSHELEENVKPQMRCQPRGHIHVTCETLSREHSYTVPRFLTYKTDNEWEIDTNMQGSHMAP